MHFRFPLDGFWINGRHQVPGHPSESCSFLQSISGVSKVWLRSRWPWDDFDGLLESWKIGVVAEAVVFCHNHTCGLGTVGASRRSRKETAEEALVAGAEGWTASASPQVRDLGRRCSI
uniref:Uncharacterized protein LOC104221791 isoform X1 n=1 Tax=Nicotiana sylvestris TaxID=4096 RepID=A0A1U7VTL1_NICSY|nr:PREDICTED: uncharacterized protein LOC104221791 isoform X1 [Nicotiana sylvestris]